MTTSATLSPLNHEIAAMLSGLVPRATDAARFAVRAYRNRLDASVLAGADARMLADIGLTHSDLRDAFAEPLWRDPTSLLGERASGRRKVRRS